ncbi:sigma-70 family RNA polymerase sigma factor [Chitinophaga sp. RCC_12]|uniref:sigma-70 family RNA polymerase sigma factor n=1 Tax=Chitinophaga sp. RCC_12 TaxID=3239226 RepID=UPI0035245FA4
MTIQKEAIAAQVPDQEAIERILAGEKKMFSVIINRYNQRLYRIGMSILENDSATEDAMQNTYLNAYCHLSQFQHRASFGTWLTRIMLNQCYELKRKNNLPFSSQLSSDKFIDMKTPARDLANKELNQILEDAITRLPEKYRLVFMLREIEEMSVRETSETLAIEENNVKVRLNRAKAMLRKDLTAYMKDHVYHFHLTRCDRITRNVLQKLGIEGER